MDEKTLITSLAKIAQETWQDEKRPVLFSNIPRLLASTDFRSVIGDEGVKGFVKRTSETGGYKIVEHPTHKARIGIIPAGESYEFPMLAPQVAAEGEGRRKGEAMLSFLELLGGLTAEEQSSVVIPVNVIIKLLRK